MSVNQAAILFDGDMPTLAQVAARARELGYDVAFSEDLDLRAHSGQLSAVFEGKPTGFLTSYGPAEEFDWMPPALQDQGDRLLEIETVGGDYQAGLFANVFLRAFCDLANAGWWYLDVDDAFQLPGTTNNYFDEQITAYRAHIAKLSAHPPSPSPPSPPDETREATLFGGPVGGWLGRTFRAF